MNISIVTIIIFSIIILFLQYIIIEAAVKRAIEVSRTHELLEEILEVLKKDKNS